MKKHRIGCVTYTMPMQTDVSSGTSIVCDASALTSYQLTMDFEPANAQGIPVQIGVVSVGELGVMPLSGPFGVRQAGEFGVTRPGEFGSAQVPHHERVRESRFTFPGHDGRPQPVTTEEFELYVSEEDAEAHTDLGIMRKQFLADLAERGLTESDYLAIEQAEREQAEREAVRAEMPPGARMLEFSTILFSRRGRDLLVEPIIADYRFDMDEALANGAGKWKIRAIRTRYWIAYIVGFLDEVLPVLGRLWRSLSGS